MGAAVPSKAELRTDCCGLRVARRRGGPMRKLSVTLRDGERNCEAVQYALTVQHQRSRNPPCRRRLEHCGAARRDGVNRPASRNITEAHRQVVHLSRDPRWRFPSAFPTAPASRVTRPKGPRKPGRAWLCRGEPQAIIRSVRPQIVRPQPRMPDASSASTAKPPIRISRLEMSARAMPRPAPCLRNGQRDSRAMRPSRRGGMRCRGQCNRAGERTNHCRHCHDFY